MKGWDNSQRGSIPRSNRSEPRINILALRSETTEREIDVAVRDIVTKAFEQATAILRTRRADLDEGGRLLLARETLTADQFPAIRPATKQPETVS